MKISVIGCGYLGAVHAACMADLGHHVVGVDVDTDRIAELAAGRAPFHEPGFDDLLAGALASGRLTFTTDLRQVEDATVHFICVGTPQSVDSRAADMTFVDDAFAALGEVLEGIEREVVVVGKSTVPVGTAERVAHMLEQSGAVLVWNPEFLREGYAVQDTLSPDRIVYGIPDGEAGERATETLDEVYQDQLRRGITRVVTDYATAELVKMSANAFLATKISFINAVAEICDATGADVTELARIIGMDERIGKKFLQAGVGFGGGCLPKDLRAFTARAEELGQGRSVRLLHEVEAINDRRRGQVVELVQEALGDHFIDAKVAVLGAAFKPYSDDLRDSPALDVALRLRDLGARVVITDPVALGKVERLHPDLEQSESLTETLRGSDAIVLVTEWREYVILDPEEIGHLVRKRNVVDGRNVLNPTRWRDAGWTYRGLGRR